MSSTSTIRQHGVLQIEATHEAMSRRAAQLIAAGARENPRLLLGLATGSTPAGAYDLFADHARREPHLFNRIRLLKLDEWGGLAMNDPATCEAYLRQKLIEPLAITSDRYIVWNSRPGDPEAECRRIATWLADHGPIDLCVLGLGANGHLAFNEPADFLTPGPHVARLTETSLRHPMLQSARGRPQFGLTVGMADILQSRRVLLLVSGGHKATQLRRFMEGRITTQFPASFLLLHPNLTVLCDREAASLIQPEA
jgi:galactosamine-6-phosphate isomerase